jgi:CheY-like chemotaxis protein
MAAVFMNILEGALILLYSTGNLTFIPAMPGTAVNESLPPTETESPAKPEALGHALQPRARRILVVDDEPAARVLGKRVFSEAGFEVATVQSGFECLELFRQHPRYFDLILLDLSMPFMDGEETFTRLRAINPNVVVLLSTGFMAQERVERMLAAGMAGFLRKPHNPAELVAQVESALKKVNMSRAGCAAADITVSI